MSATFQISAAELDSAVLRKIRAFAAGRNFSVVIRLEEQSALSEPLESGNAKLESPMAYTKRMLQKSGADPIAMTQIMEKYRHFNVDMSNFKFNRDEANER